MTISYRWLLEYLPISIEVERLSEILTSIGLEVESVDPYQSVRGGLKGLVIGQVMEVSKHPDADKLRLTKVDIGKEAWLEIVCGAPNVAQGQKVVVAQVGSTIYPNQGEPLTIRQAKIRGAISQGMLCAEDEIGLGESHAGILVLPSELPVGMEAADYFQPYEDILITIGLTPNRVDAMSHLGVARDVCAYLSCHGELLAEVRYPQVENFRPAPVDSGFQLKLENPADCARFSAVLVDNIQIGPSPLWMQQRLKALGIRPINNIVDITNFVLQETGQPLHAYDADRIQEKKVVVKTLPEGTLFVTLDGKERKLSSRDIMVCDASKPLCIAGVFGGLGSGVTENTRNVFLESAWFDPQAIRKTSFSHGLRTEAALHFEKGMDISQTFYALQRAACLMVEYAGARLGSAALDVFPNPLPKAEVSFTYEYLQRLSGMDYPADKVKKILRSLGFEIYREDGQSLGLRVPFHKGDIRFAADVVEEIMRIDGLDNIPIPASIRITPSVDSSYGPAALKEKTSAFLAGAGFQEIFTNSITNQSYYRDQDPKSMVQLLNNLSAELNVLRTTLLHSGLESIAFNVNRKNPDLLFFEFGKTYHRKATGDYRETDHCCLWVTGKLRADHWKGKGQAVDQFYLKGMVGRLSQLIGIGDLQFQTSPGSPLEDRLVGSVHDEPVVELGSVSAALLREMDLRQPVYYADLQWNAWIGLAEKHRIEYQELPRQLPVGRDLALVVDKSLAYGSVESALHSLKLSKLRKISLFDVFESEKLGPNKKSLAIALEFLDEEKTMTDREIDELTQKVIRTLETTCGAEIRK